MQESRYSEIDFFSFPPFSLFFSSKDPLMVLEYRTFFIASQLMVNILIPFFIWKHNFGFYALYAGTLLVPLLTLCFIYYKKRAYFNKYLCRQYVPSIKLALFAQTGTTSLIFAMYYHIYFNIENTAAVLYALFAHLLFIFSVFIALLFQKSKSKAIISYVRHKYKIGILARDTGGEKGLKKGQPVEIVQETKEGYVVKNSSNDCFQVTLDDIESVYDVV